MSTATSDQLLDMLGTIDETAAFLRKRCASGQAGQSMTLFEDLASLLELLDSRYRKSGYLPKEKAPSYSGTPDILTAVRFLDAVDVWSGKIRDRVKRRKVRRELAMGGILEAAAKEGKPFVRQAEEMAQFVQAVRPGTPEERAEQEAGVSVAFSSEAMEKARAAREEAPPPKPAAPQPTSLTDTAAEGARLFAGMRARKGGRSLALGEESPEGQPEDSGPKPMGARDPDSGPKPMGARDREGPKPMGARDREGPKPMGARDREGPKPMGARDREGPKPMGARDPDSGPKPMGAKDPDGGPKPMGKKPEAPAPQRPAAPETTTTPAAGRGIAIDREFLRIMNELGSIAEEDLEKRLVAGFPKLENRYKMVICDQIRRCGYWGRLEPDRKEFEALRRRAQELVQHRDEYSWLYGRLGDYRSRRTLLAILDNWYSYNFKDLANMKEKLFAPYLDADLLRCTDEEVFVDLGAGTGEVTCSFADFAGHWKKIYAYEPYPGSFSVLRGRVKDLGLVDARQKAVSDKPGTANLAVKDDPLLSRLAEEGTQVDAVILDEDIEEPISILKMCLEGGEQAAIRGCSNHIHRDHPKLVMRADHGDSDLWQLPRMIERLDKKYRFFLRHYGGNLVPMEYVIYAI